MVTELIKLKVKKESATGTESERIIKYFVESCKRLDASIFEPLISEEQMFESLDKYRFLQSLKDKFDFWKNEGFTRTEMKEGTCGMCHYGEMVYEFYVNDSKIAFAYIIHNNNNNELEDIFICNGASGYSSCH